MNLIVFDIDGTLTQTTEVDSNSFIKAVTTVLQIQEINTNWAQYQYSTDSGILNEIYELLFKRKPNDHEINTIQDRFVDCLKQAWLEDNLFFAPIPGADKIFAKINNLAHWHIGIATGTWRRSALFKLNAAKIPHAQLSKAYADDHVERTEIIKTTIKQAQALYQVHQYERLIYVGDKDWDYRAAKELNMEFIGIGSAFVNAPNINLRIADYKSDQDLLGYLK